MIRQDRTNKTVTIEHENGSVTFSISHDAMVEMSYETEDGESEECFWAFSLYEIEALARIAKQHYARILDEAARPHVLQS